MNERRTESDGIAGRLFGRGSLLRRCLRIAGIDRAVGWTAAPRLWSSVAGPISVVLIGTRLTAEEQGYYYTFVGVLALMVFFELGLGSIIQQFASHEYAFLRWDENGGALTGSETNKARLASLTGRAIRWYGIASVLLIGCLLIAGYRFFGAVDTGTIEWRGPWVAQAILAGASLLLAPAFALLEGCGKLADVARIRTLQVIFSNLAGWTVLLAGGRLWISAAIWAASTTVGFVWILSRWRPFFTDLLRSPGSGLSWIEEVWPLQWRTAAGWASGFVALQMVTPVLFRFEGPVSAGRMGMSISVVSSIAILSMAWTKARLPMFGEKIARADFKGLDAIFFPTLWRAVAVMTSGGLVLMVVVISLRRVGHPFAERLLHPLPLALLIVAFLAKQIVAAESAYFRAHKQEPLLANKVTGGLLIAASTLVLGHRWGDMGIVVGYLSVTLVVSLGISTWIFQRKRREWHGELRTE